MSTSIQIQEKISLGENYNGVQWVEISLNLDVSDTDEYGLIFETAKTETISVGFTENGTILDCDGCPMTDGDRGTEQVRNFLSGVDVDEWSVEK